MSAWPSSAWSVLPCSLSADRSTMLQTLNFLAGGRQIDAKANFFRYETCNAFGADESIRVKADGNDLGLFLPGDFVDLPIFATRWEVVPVTLSAIGTVRLGAGKVGSSRLTGNVRVLDGERDKVLSGNCFRGIVSQNGGAIAAAVGIYNGSTTKNVFVQAVRIGSNTADVHTLFRTTTNITSAANMAAAGIGSNLNSAGQVSAVSVCGGNPAAGIGSFTGVAQMAQGYLVASSDSIMLLPRQALLLPGQGLVEILSGAVTNIRTTWEWEEWPQ